MNTRSFAIKIQLDHGSFAPERAHPYDAGLDLKAMHAAIIPAHGRATIDTGVHLAVPEGYVGMLTSKSGLMHTHGITSRGTIDSHYTGSVQAILFNHSDHDYVVAAGDKVTQLVLMPVWIPDELVLVDKLPETDRGGSGFGSSGR